MSALLVGRSALYRQDESAEGRREHRLGDRGWVRYDPRCE
nr:hypothetical protein JVH1_3055 [Rhodococcus sp. JVH1]